MVRIALHHDIGRRRNRLPDFAGYLGVVQKAPIIDVRMFKSFNFASASLMMFTLGILLFSSLVLMPQFLQTLLGLHLGTGWACPFGGRSGLAHRDADHGPTDN